MNGVIGFYVISRVNKYVTGVTMNNVTVETPPTCANMYAKVLKKRTHFQDNEWYPNAI